MKIETLMFLFVVALFSLTSSTSSQTNITPVLDAKGSCEENIVAMEGVMRKSMEENGHIFVISHRSKLEQKGVDWARLRYTRMALSQFRQFPVDKITIAVGEPTEEHHGKLEFWVSGRLALIAYVKKNQQACFHT